MTRNKKILKDLQSIICGSLLVFSIFMIAFAIVSVPINHKGYSIDSEPYKVIDNIDKYYINKENQWHGRYNTVIYELFYVKEDEINKLKFNDIYIEYNSDKNCIELYENSSTFLGIKLHGSDSVIVYTTKDLDTEEIELIKYRLINGKSYEDK